MVRENIRLIPKGAQAPEPDDRMSEKDDDTLAKIHAHIQQHQLQMLVELVILGLFLTGILLAWAYGKGWL